MNYFKKVCIFFAINLILVSAADAIVPEWGTWGGNQVSFNVAQDAASLTDIGSEYDASIKLSQINCLNIMEVSTVSEIPISNGYFEFLYSAGYGAGGALTIEITGTFSDSHNASGSFYFYAWDPFTATCIKSGNWTASFKDCSLPPVRRFCFPCIGGYHYYESFQDAYNAAGSVGSVESQAYEMAGDLTINQNKTVTFKGGYDCVFEANELKTVINGTVVINAGTVIFENIAIQ